MQFQVIKNYEELSCSLRDSAQFPLLCKHFLFLFFSHWVQNDVCNAKRIILLLINCKNWLKKINKVFNFGFIFVKLNIFSIYLFFSYFHSSYLFSFHLLNSLQKLLSTLCFLYRGFKKKNKGYKAIAIN